MMRKYHTQFTEKNLTGNAGITHFGRFAEKLGVEKTLERFLSIERAGNCDYSAAAVIIMLVMGVLAGCRHLSHLVIIKDDPVLTKLFNWAEFPVDTTFSRIFKLFSHKHCNELSDAEAEIRNKVWSRKYRGRVTCDMDSTVRGVSGAQEGAR